MGLKGFTSHPTDGTLEVSSRPKETTVLSWECPTPAVIHMLMRHKHAVTKLLTTTATRIS